MTPSDKLLKSIVVQVTYTSVTFAPVASHTADMALIEEMRCARNAFAASFESSELQTLVLKFWFLKLLAYVQFFYLDNSF